MSAVPLPEPLQPYASKLSAGRVRRHVFLCAQQTTPKCSTFEQSTEVWEYLKRRVRELGIDGMKPPPPGTDCPLLVHRNKVDCLRICTNGPIAVVYPEGIWYHSVSVPVMERILIEHVIGGVPVEDHVLARAPL